MSFKVKSWNSYRSKSVGDFGLKAYMTPGAAGIITRSYHIPWGGEILILAYLEDDTPAYGVYYPESDTFSLLGTHDRAWSTHSAFHGWMTSYVPWSDKYLVGGPLSAGYYYGAQTFWGWTPDFTFLTPAWECGRETCYPSDAGIGCFGGEPCVLSYQYTRGEGNRAICRTTLAGSSVVATGDDIYFHYTSGSARFGMKQLEGYYRWVHEDGSVLYTFVPTEDTKDGYIALGNFGTNWTELGVMARGLNPSPGGGAVVIKANAGQGDYWAYASSPLTPIDLPWQSNWHYRQMQDGGYSLDEHDLDGLDHGESINGPLTVPPTKHGSWYFGVEDYVGGSFTVWVLDAPQPSGRARRKGRAVSGFLGWMGEYALGTDLSLRHVLPLPEDRNPSGSGAMPPQERNDGYLVGSKELFQGSGSQIKYVRDISLDLSSYPHGGDWWFPGEEGTRYPGFWHLFAGIGPTIIGYMPDPDWGALNPLGQSCMRFLGQPVEDLKASDGHPTHVVRNSYALSGTTFAQPITGTFGQVRTMLHSGLDGKTFCFVTTGVRGGQKPAYKAVVGTIDYGGRDWKTVKQFTDADRPGLGETGWTIWSIVPIPRCRALPLGGYLVGATLYFAPWKEGAWEWDPGPRDAVFAGTSNGWVPAKPGWRGPLNDDNHHPIYLTGYDEWTVGRSLYGPDALLVYDENANFVTHLNSLDVHAPDGREVIVTGEANPKIVFRIYRWGTYSDFAEGYGQYHRLAGNEEVQAPLYVCYDLMNGGRVQPGLGTFHGFVDMYEVGEYAPKDSTWRWGVPSTIYDWQYPKTAWRPPASAYVRSGRGASGVTLLGGNGTGRGGVRGVGARGH